MRFNALTFIIGSAIAKNRGVPSATATRDGLLSAVIGPPVLGIVMASALANKQEAEVAPLAIGAAPDAPVVTAVAVSSTSVVLTWSATANTRSYRVHRHAAKQAADTFAASVTAYEDDTVSENTTYHYSVDALDADNRIIAKSASVRVTTPKSG
jgi:phage tail sheath gpL-like